MPEHFRRMAWLMGPLSEKERKSFVGLLTKVLERAAELPPTPVHAPAGGGVAATSTIASRPRAAASRAKS